ncbi:lysozyme inhibitor LprI family protein [Variovorax sp. SRS16]|uniref:lysozyme inhibitor LprI family protein n=1 Tax=Variovorax sp. SRS16 TaxID=282217 RepID=UPI0022B29866|nr:lysozyme inhibitor LprI family protein [Variovorax sp. SRS16]
MSRHSRNPRRDSATSAPPVARSPALGRCDASTRGYTAARARLDDAGKAALRDEQRAWIKTREATCGEAKIAANIKGDIAGGSPMALEVAGCQTKLTEQRTKELHALVASG